jgi:D-lyxose ketol-isomerase
MKRSVINAAYCEALDSFRRAGWILPPKPRWDITDCGSGDFDRCGITLINLAEEPEYAEKLIYMRVGQIIPLHTHRCKKEDIICRRGAIMMELWQGRPGEHPHGTPLRLRVNGEERVIGNGQPYRLEAGERATLVPGVYHRFGPVADNTIIGEVSTANDDLNDNVYFDLTVARFPGVEEDEPPLVRLVRDL